MRTPFRTKGFAIVLAIGLVVGLPAAAIAKWMGWWPW